MKKEIIGIVAEFNPLHNGHKRLIDHIKNENPESVIAVVMSGQFVQRGELAIYDKWTRANAAIDNGVDLVIEIPPYYVLNHANLFASKSIELLNNFGAAKVYFGTESLTIESINSIVDKAINNQDELERLKKEHHSLPKAFNEFIKTDIKANDTLGICYVLEARKNNIDIEFNRIIRESNEDFISASKIREDLHNGIKNDKSLINNNEINNIEDYSDVIIGKLLTSDSNDNTINYLKGKAIELNTNSFTELINESANKSFTKSKLRRELVKFTLELENSNNQLILGVSKEGRKILKDSVEYTFRHDKSNIDNYKVERFLSIKSNNTLEENLKKMAWVR